MGKRTPPLTNKEDYLRNHLFNDLRWLLHAATEWSIQRQLELNIVGYNVQVYAMDSAFLHARALFEFFVQPTGGNYYSVEQFVGAPLTSSDYKDDKTGWKGPLHAHLMHAQDRSKPRKLQSPDGPKDLNEMPVYFAHEILRLWKEFEQELGKSNKPQDQKLQALAREKRGEAIDGAQCVVDSEVARQHAKAKNQSLKPVFIFS